MSNQFRNCLICDNPLERVDDYVSKYVSFRGEVLFCFTKCKIPYFLEGMNYLSKEGNVSQKSPFELPQDSPEAGEKKGRVFLVNHQEADWVVITPERIEMPRSETLHIQIGAHRLTSQLSAFLVNLCLICFTLLSYHRQTMLLNISFLGYNNDPRRIWEIPEVAEWYYRFWLEYGDVTCYMDIKGLFPFAVTVCTMMTPEYITERVEKNDMALFNAHKNHPAALRFAVFHAFSENFLYHRCTKGTSPKFTHNEYENWIKPFRERIRQIEEPVVREVEKQLNRNFPKT